MARATELSGQVARLNAIEVEDAVAIIRIRNTPGFEVGLPPIPTDVARQEDWIRTQLLEDGDFYFGIRSVGDPALVGTIGVTQQATLPGPWSADGAWEWGRWASVAKDPRIPLEAASLTLKFAAAEGARAIWVRLLPGNDRLITFHQRLGYTHEWTTRDGTFMRADGDDIHRVSERLVLGRW